MQRGTQFNRTSGFTTVELMIAMAIFAAVFSAFALATLSASDSYKVGSARSDLESKAYRTLERITSSLDHAQRDSVNPEPSPPLGSSQLDFQEPSALTGAALMWTSPVQRFAFAMDPAELDNGVDDNGNGLIDEGVVVWTEDPSGPNSRSVIICRNVREFLEGEVFNGLDDNGNGLRDERGLSFDIVNGLSDVVTVRLTLEDRDEEGRLLTATVETSVRIRN